MACGRTLLLPTFWTRQVEGSVMCMSDLYVNFTPRSIEQLTLREFLAASRTFYLSFSRPEHLLE